MAEKKTDEKVLAEALKRYDYAHTADDENRKAARDDTRFVWVKGAQWPQSSRDQREQDDRPWLEVNQLPQFIKQVVNDQRQNRPGIRISPAGGEASEEVAEILQGLCRNIEYDSNAEAAYDVAFESAVTGGRGYWRVLTDYEGPDSFDQKILIKRIADPESVVVDPDFQEPDASDIKFAFVTELMTRSDFEAAYPDCEPLSWQPSEHTARWYDGEDKVVVCDYYRRVAVKRKLVQLDDGWIGFEDDLKEAFKRGERIAGQSGKVVRERDVEDFKVEWYKLAGGEQTLATYEWAGKFIPIIVCVGDEIIVEGKRMYQGLIRRAKDSQTLFNLSRTAIAEHMALSPKAPWIAEEGQIAPYKATWDNAHKKSYVYLPYKATSVNGNSVPPPQRVPYAGVPTGLVEQSNECKMDLRATIGLYDPSLGQRSNETSGRAIMARERQGDTATFHFIDNLARAIAHTGRVVLDLVPHIYDTQRMVRVLEENGDSRLEPINEEIPGGEAVEAIVRNDVRVGKYAVSVSSGPSYSTKRAEAAEFMMQAVQSAPQLMQIAGDVIFKQQDVAGAEELAERMEMVLPPQIQQAIAAKKQSGQTVPPQVIAQMQAMQAQLQQAGAMVQQLTAQVQQLESGVEAQREKAQLDAQTKVQTEIIKVAGDIVAQNVAALNAPVTMDQVVGEVVNTAEQVASGAANGGEPVPNTQADMRTVLQSFEQTMAQVAQAIAAANLTPRQLQIQTDPAGNVIGGVSVPVTQGM